MRATHVLGALLVVAAAGAAGAYAWFDRATQTPVDPAGAEKARELTVPKGATTAQVARLLEQEGLIRDARLMRLYLRLNPGAPSPKAGRHLVHPGMNVPELIRALAQNPIPDDVPLTLVEGWRLRDADAFLTSRGLIEAGEYQRAAEDPSRFQIPFPFDGKDLEGYLYPETYMVPPGKLDVARLIQRQLDAFHQRFSGPYLEEIQKTGRSLSDVVIMASLLEREEPDPALRPQVAGVLFKRLDARTPLGVDATSRYTITDWNDRRAFLKMLRDPADPYNTRLKVGLPPGPIGAPSLPSLVSALRPVPSEYWYYLHDSERRIHFGRTAQEHEANRRRYNVW